MASFPTQVNLKEGVNDDLAVPPSATVNTALLRDVMQTISPDDIMEGIVHSALGKRKSPFEETPKPVKRTREDHTDSSLPLDMNPAYKSPKHDERPEKIRKASIPRGDGKEDVVAIPA